MRILEALKSYDFSVHGPGDSLKLILRLRNICLLRQEDVVFGREVEALKSCDEYSQSTYDFAVHGPGDVLKFILHVRKLLLLRREHVFSGRGVGALKARDAYSRST